MLQAGLESVCESRICDLVGLFGSLGYETRIPGHISDIDL